MVIECTTCFSERTSARPSCLQLEDKTIPGDFMIVAAMKMAIVTMMDLIARSVYRELFTEMFRTCQTHSPGIRLAS